MANLYSIEQNLNKIFNDIEELNGEITPELEEELAITQEDFTNKIENYVHKITMLEGEIASIKVEQDRLKDLKTSKERTIIRLKSAIADAIVKFGDTSKSGSKFIDYGIGKVSLRKSKSIEYNEDEVKDLVTAFKHFVNFQTTNNQMNVTGITFEDFIEYYNNTRYDETTGKANGINVKSIDDLTGVNAKLIVNINLKELFNEGKNFNIIRTCFKDTVVDVSPKVEKINVKQYIESNQKCPSYIEFKNNNTVIFK